ncbi:P-loop containing nucleoside triphosphate hydrolase protein [Paraphysoderma sedebokerense]|nr:P-loop containing nucleoside triphosphate hydrolase protein [Paraphysoderma sedebokerense]
MMSGRITSNDTRSFQISASVSARPHDVYLDKQQTLVSLILATQEVITNFQYINQHKWLLHYPFIHHPHRAGLHRSVSEVEANYDVQRQRSLPPLLSPQLETSTNRLLLDESRRTVSSPVIVRSPPRHNQVSSPSQSWQIDPPMSDLTILNLDLKLGSHSGASNVVSNLEKKSVASLLDNKFSDTVIHLDKLLSRVLDNTSRVLVTGDLNAGKSTFINALLRKRLLPDDQQPLTGVFCEVIHPTHNNGIEEIHAITDTANYDISDSSTYNRYDLSSLQSLVSEPKKEFSLLKIYAVDNRPREQSLINNGVVDITLIDSPGLNRDIIKTMSLFSRQKEIDVVVFVVNAENHFTLSAKEFLHQAGLEKAYIFIVINKFDNIRDKSRCRQLVLEQIRNLSPRTYADHQNLVHFVSSQEILGQTYSKSAESKSLRNEFLSLESALRTFTLEKRAISKLTPAKTFLDKLLGDMIVIANLNDEIASQKLSEVQHDLNSFKPHHARLLKMQKEVSKQIEQNIGKTCSLIETHTRTKMERLREKLLNQSEMIPWRGILQTGSYIIEMKRRLQDIVFDELIECERFARCETVNCMNKIVELVDNQTLNGPSLPSIESSSSSSTVNVSVVSTTSTYTYPTSTTSSPTASSSLTTSVIPDTSRITSLFPVSFSLSVSHFFVTYRNRIVDSFSVMNFASYEYGRWNGILRWGLRS